MIIADQAQRLKALNTAESFIVQAPAGSGKTELLIQRYLALLTTVKHPEEIIAITFTKKAASEMHERIIQALAIGHAPEPEKEPAKQRWKLASAALEHDKKLQWNLEQNPKRMRIQTIDAFCSSLVQRMPLQARTSTTLKKTEQADILYQQAVKMLMQTIHEDTEYNAALGRFMLHLDNDSRTIERLLVAMLACRDQWLPFLISHSMSAPAQLKAYLEKNLLAICSHYIKQLEAQFSKVQREELNFLLNFAKEHCDEKTMPCVFRLNQTQENRIFWLAAAELLLTKQDEWRAKVDKRQGFHPTAKEEKQRLIDLITSCQQTLGLFDALIEIRSLPCDVEYPHSQWQLIEDLLVLLPILTGMLKIVFQEQQEIDFIEIAQAAVHALGTVEEPTDLSLALDYRIQHILMDEFQDTSLSQFELLEKLTWNWSPLDRKTLFLVGDPMQSIYRFRQAEVGLFIRAQQFGINAISLNSLSLTVNFRADGTLVDWYNQQFHRIFPRQNDMSKGAICYTQASSFHPVTESAKISWHAYDKNTEDVEAATIVRLIQNAWDNNPQEKIAVLVKAKTHLSHIIRALRKAAIPFHAVDIETLGESPIVQDLFSLTKALLFPYDRLAWFSILRAPWCGFTLKELYTIASYSSQQCLWENLVALYPNHLLVELFHKAFDDLGNLPLHNLVENVWLSLGGLFAYEKQPSDEIALVYFDLLKKHQKTCSLLNLTPLENDLKNLYAKTKAEDTRLQLMTIHKSKGLEFDRVILPQLHALSRGDEDPLLRWQKCMDEEGNAQLLCAPIKAAHEDEDSIYHFLKCLEKNKAEQEVCRLLYVAVTRAKKYLHLFAGVELSNDGTIKPAPKNSLLHKLIPALFEEGTQPEMAAEICEIEQKEEKFLTRLPKNWRGLPLKI